MAVTNITTSNLANDIKTFYDRTLLWFAKPKQVHNQFGKPGTVPKGSRSIEWRRFDILTVSATPESAYSTGVLLSEGVTPPDTLVPTVAIVTSTPAQYGAFLVGTDLVETTSIDPIKREFAEKLGIHAGMSLDRITRNSLAAGTNIVYASTATSNVTVTSAMLPAYADLIKAIKTLKNQNVEPCRNGRWCAVIHPNTWAALMVDATFKDAVINGLKDNLFEGTLGVFMGIEFYETTEARVIAGAGAAGIDVYSTLIFGAEGFGVVKLAQMGLQTIDKAPGENGDDPLNQRWTMAWKASHEAKILNNNCFLQLRHAV